MRVFSYIMILSFLVLGYCGFGQHLDSLKDQLETLSEDTASVWLLSRLSGRYTQIDPDSSIIYGEDALALSRKIGYRGRDAAIYRSVGHSYRNLGDFPKALEMLFKALEIAKELDDYGYIARIYNSIGIVYSQLNDNQAAAKYQKQAIEVFEAQGEVGLMTNSKVNLGRAYRRSNQLDSALFYFQEGFQELDRFRNDNRHAFLAMEMGSLQWQLGNVDSAFLYLRQSVRINENNASHFYNSFAYNVISEFFQDLNETDSSIHYAKKALMASELGNTKFNTFDALKTLANQYESKNIDSAYHYLMRFKEINDQLYGPERVIELQRILAEEQARQRQIEEERIAYNNRVKQSAVLMGLLFLMTVTGILFQNNRRKQKANTKLRKQKEEIESAMERLASTQTQLIHSEKMASLGELTAGIAHEIQNPLNFVNNFSDVNKDLAEEMIEEMKKGNLEEAEAIGNDLIANEAKITHHGKRAEEIVKSMLQHSRWSDGEKQLTNINDLADEYVRLAYHGLRAKEPSFNAEIKTDFDPNLPEINIVPQDIGRVLLNLLNNAFSAVSDVEGPTVNLKTQKLNNSITITISDNGPGIPSKIRDKIFQPFFTTKPTGQGTGLGLSLSYDIVTKGHGGSLEMETEEGEGSEFIINLAVVS